MKRVKANNFEATQKWKEMIRQFVEEVPLDKNRRMIRNYVDSFTGASAADTLEPVLARVFPERTCDRTNAIRVLQKFVEENIIEDVQEPAFKQFRDDTSLYRIRESALHRYDLKMPIRIRRSASLDTSKSRNMSFDFSQAFSRKSSEKEPPVRLVRAGSFKRMLRHRNSSCSMNISSTGAPLAGYDEDETPPKTLKIRYASADENCENDGANKSLFYGSQLTQLLEGIIKNQKLSDKERHDKIMHFKGCYPDIFELRFPNDSYVSPQFSMFDRLKSFIGA
ncbi:DEP domain-containing 1A isoform X2 [Aphelenchoides bicaudatus]|nr:DEP domain-containing 1A isoform X2 [Aphelenchoides bicaudatus]